MSNLTRQEYELLVELALAVHEMAPPDRQRSIARKFDAMINEEQRLAYEQDTRAPPASGDGVSGREE